MHAATVRRGAFASSYLGAPTRATNEIGASRYLDDMKNGKTIVLLIGGYGFFGERLARLLSTDAELKVIIAGRSLDKAKKFVETLVATGATAELEAAYLDSNSSSLALDVAATGAAIAVNLSGPFQNQGYHVASACIDARVHYLDLADAREFVNGIVALQGRAEAAGVVVISGASSVPALSSAVLDHLAPAFSEMSFIDIGISPGNQTDRGTATVSAILSYCGEPIRIWKDAEWLNESGWTKHVRHNYPAPVGARWLTLCEVPDLDLHLQRYPAVRSVIFRGGLELGVLHFGLAFVSVLRQARLLPRLPLFAGFAKRASELVINLGSDAGAMHVDVAGKGQDGRTLRKRWTLVAERGDGPYIPTLAAATLIRKLKRHELSGGRATPCVGLVSLRDIEAEFGTLAIRTGEDVL
jgi:saccharopine dehydrogenase-like NADP-dependent oxidoreductase